jgi:hypothetical protein
MTSTFSLLHATYGRPQKAIAAMRMALERAADPKGVEYIFAANTGDVCLPMLQVPGQLTPARTDVALGDFAGSAPAWDAAAKLSTGHILIQMQDDLELPRYWDALLLLELRKMPFEGGPNAWQEIPLFIAVSDGYRKDGLCCTAIMNRARYEQVGEFLHAGYQSVFSDDEVTYRALRDAQYGACKFIDARNIIFRHRHHYHDKTVPMDATYERENSPEAYRIGSELFAKRNPSAATDGIRTWG